MSKEIHSNHTERSHHFGLRELIQMLPVLALPFLVACSKPELPSQILAVTYDSEGDYQRRALVLFEDYPTGDVYQQPQVLLDGLEANFPGQIALSPNGQSVLTVMWDGHDWEIFNLDANSHALTNLTNDEVDNFDPSWSPDGKQIVYYSSNPNILEADIFVMDRDGQNIKKLTDSKRVYLNPVLSPDGNKVALRSYEKDHGHNFMFRLEILDIHSGQTDVIGEIDGLQEFIWSPDGKKLAYNGLDSSKYYSDLYVIDLATREVTDITPLPSNQWSIDWSLDGSLIVFVSDHLDDSADICLVEPDGDNLHCLTQYKTQALNPQFSLDGQNIYFDHTLAPVRKDEVERYYLYRIPVKGGDARNVSIDIRPYGTIYTFEVGNNYLDGETNSLYPRLIK